MLTARDLGSKKNRRFKGPGARGGIHRPTIDRLVQRLPRSRAGSGRASVRQTRRGRALAPRVAVTAAVIALFLTLVLSAALGWGGGSAALFTVLCGWAYNLGLKSTVLSWLPYAIAFGFLPDLREDVANGVRGLPHRLGAKAAGHREGEADRVATAGSNPK